MNLPHKPLAHKLPVHNFCKMKTKHNLLTEKIQDGHKTPLLIQYTSKFY